MLRRHFGGVDIMAWDFTLTEEQRMLVDTVRQFMEKEIIPHEREIERLGEVPIELGKQIQKRAKEQGLYAANMPEEAAAAGSISCRRR